MVARTGTAVVLAAVVLVAGCGGSGNRAKSSKLVQRSFPTLRVEVAAGVDSLDPGLSYSPECWQSLWNVYLSPYGYQHAKGKASSQIVPALAEGMPDVSSGGRVYEFRLRKGLRYSNGKPVLAADFAYAIRRLYLLDSVGAPLFDDVVGASVSAARRDLRHRDRRLHEIDHGASEAAQRDLHQRACEPFRGASAPEHPES